MKQINIGVLGYANIAMKAILPAIESLPSHFKLMAIASTNAKKQFAIRSKYPDINIFTSYQDLIDFKQIDAIYIPLPNSLHYEWIKKALENNIHVFVEKSLACSYNEVFELNTLAQNNNLVLIENFQFRMHPQLDFLKRFIETGKLGQIRYFRSTFSFPPFPDSNNIRYQKDLGGGALLDAGAYPIKIAQELMGMDIELISANTYISDKTVDVAGGGTIKQRKGTMFLQFAFGFDHFYQCNIEVLGTLGKLYTNRIFTAPPNHNPLFIHETPEGTHEIILASANAYCNMLNHFYDCIFNKKLRTTEYNHNIVQAKLLNQFKLHLDE